MLELVVAAARQEADRIRSLRLVAVAGAAERGPHGVTLPPFTAGAHLRVHGRQLDGTPSVRAYSLVNDPLRRDHYEIGVLREGRGGMSDWLHTLQPGDTLHVEPPRNDFALMPHAEAHVLIAGGIGITPLLSMAAALHRQRASFRLVVLARSRETLAFADRLSELGDAVELHLSATGRRLDVAGLMRGLAAGTHVYVCGPARLLAATTAAAHAARFPPGRVHYERFSAAGTPADAPFEVEFARSGLTLAIEPHETILDKALDAGIFPAYDCRRGECGTCLTRVLAGEADHRDTVQSEIERARGEYIAICCSRAKSSRLVLDL